jgi:hypothetical protein
MASYFGRKNPKRSSSNLLSLNAGGIGSGTGGSAAVVQVNAAAGRKKVIRKQHFT